ncbi:uncharacterized protein CDV56_105631 [Aspergillus thermomutatus]|uniref:Uncharacterized protein n=1 Tax=Aspergillus thermomutatus TaxID=41047 RepID=A0A397H5D5_ASPTH|nr:uncharacterized protein CDV56_105631 [Aspergillus thermomutatus]RHZ58237.1 hypothetical protein CDV56_105631 [Aspergillus thermomutatus]
MQLLQVSGAAYYDSLLGRRPQNPPQDFTRVLYIPRHSSATVHLPLYDVAEQYHNAVKGCVLNSSQYAVQLSMMEKPRDDGMNCEVAYHVNLDRSATDNATVRLQVQRRSLFEDGEAIAQALIRPPHDGCLLAIGNSQKGTDTCCMLMAASFPIQPSIRGKYSIPHPYFTFLLPGKNNNQRIVQWQVHPKEDSLRRYTLVEIGAASEGPDVALSKDDAREPKILAIYHHIGIAVWLPKDFSEGVLLLPDQAGSEDNEREAQWAEVLDHGADCKYQAKFPKKKTARRRRLFNPSANSSCLHTDIAPVISNNAFLMMTYVVQKQNLDYGENSILFVLMQEIRSLALPDFLAESAVSAFQASANEILQCDNNISVWVRLSIFGMSSGNSIAFLLGFSEDGRVGTPSVRPGVSEPGVGVVESCFDSAMLDLALVFLGVGTRAPFHLPRLAIPQNRYWSGYPPHSKPFEMQR